MNKFPKRIEIAVRYGDETREQSEKKLPLPLFDQLNTVMTANTPFYT